MYKIYIYIHRIYKSYLQADFYGYINIFTCYKSCKTNVTFGICIFYRFVNLHWLTVIDLTMFLLGLHHQRIPHSGVYPHPHPSLSPVVCWFPFAAAAELLVVCQYALSLELVTLCSKYLQDYYRLVDFFKFVLGILFFCSLIWFNTAECRLKCLNSSV